MAWFTRAARTRVAMEQETLRVHDLVWISQDSELFPLEQPAWVRDALRRMPVVVVRRAKAAPGLIPVGVRGDGREHRYGALLRVSDVRAYRTPESVATQRNWLGNATRIPSRLREALAAVSECSDREQFVWGPIGSVGYQLATESPVTTAESDLDVMIRCCLPPDRTQLRAFDQILRKRSARVDVVLEGPLGGVALNEYLRSDEVLIKGNQGPHLAPFIW